MWKVFGLMATLWLPTGAHAFCGTYIGDGSETLYNDASQIVLARQNGQTTLTLVNDYSGDLKEFAMVIPVPTVLQEEDVRTVSGDLIDAVATFSAPREVAYTCEDFEPPPNNGGGAFGCAQDFALNTAEVPEALEDSSTVVVESEFTVGIYDIVILSAQESSDLMLWLNDNGYGVDAAAEELLGEYIDSGAFFFAAKVNLGDQLVQGALKPTWLEPLQFSYASEGFSLPIRLGTLNSRGSQDLLMYTITPFSKGQVGISNFPEVSPPKDCMLAPDQDMGEYVTGQFGQLVEEQGGTAWALEHSWSPYHCVPCVGPTLELDVLNGLGYDGDDPWFSRLHLRYSADADQDVMLYETGRNDQVQTRMIQYNAEVAHGFTFCDASTTIPDKGVKECKWLDELPQQSSLNVKPIAWLGTLCLVGMGMIRRRR